MFSTPTVLGTFRTDANGSVVIKAVVPESKEVGAHHIEVAGTRQNQPIVRTQKIEIVADSAPVLNAAPAVAPIAVAAEQAPGQLALTGSNMANLLAIGAGLITLGLLAMKRSRTNR